MAQKGVVLVPRRNDIDGMGIQFTDVRPNSSDRNLIYDGPGMTGYLKASKDAKGATVVEHGEYVGGSRDTYPLVVLAAVITAAPGNDANATTTTDYGLRAYLRDRVQKGGAGGGALTPADANTCADAITAAVEAGANLTLAAINAMLAAGAGAGTELDSTGGSKSFGMIEDILAILAGGTYKVPAGTLITNAAGPAVFLTAGERAALITAADNPALWSDSGLFIGPHDPGYQQAVMFVKASDLVGSCTEGMLHGFMQPMTFKNPKFDYTGSDITKPRAKDLAGNNLPADGTHPVLAAYDMLGVRIG